MAARSASNDDLKVRFLAHGLRFVGAFFTTAEPASRRRRSLARGVFVHGGRFTRALRFDLPNWARLMRVARLLAFLLYACTLSAIPAHAERPIADSHRLDAYFALFASDSSVPWKPASVRLDTYSSAPVTFSVYQADPADVLTAGANFNPRPIPTRDRRAAMTFTFSPPGGYQFGSNQVDMPLGNREGFYVVEARRGDVGEQVWINRSRIGLVSKQTPGGLLLYGMDLGTGQPLAHMRVQFVVNKSFVTETTDERGIVRWSRFPRPVFALAQWGNSYAFLSFLPQAPLPNAIVGVRTDSEVVHAGGLVRVVGFARTRTGIVLRPSSGSALVSLRFGARLVDALHAPLDAAGAFAAAFPLPRNAPAGEYTVLAQAAGGVGGATVQVEANAGDLALDVSAACGAQCDPQKDVPLLIHASQPGANIHVTVVRSPHVYVGYTPEGTPWATTGWLDEMVRAGNDGNATVSIPHPNDQLASTYGVHVTSGGASAQMRLVVPTAQAAVRVSVDQTEQSLGAPLGFDVYVNQLDGQPVAGATVTVQLVHGASVQQQQLKLDTDGHVRGTFSSPQLGTNLLLASINDGGQAMDAAQVQIDSQAPDASAQGDDADVQIALDKTLYHAGDYITVTANEPGAQGQALVTLEGALGVQASVATVNNGQAVARFRAADAAGELQAGAAFVQDGAIKWGAVPVKLTAPGRPQFVPLVLPEQEFAPNQDADVALDGAAPGTFIIRISRGAPSGSALFDSAPALLGIGVTTTQSSAPSAVTWHPWVDSNGDRAQVLGFVRRTQAPPEIALGQAETDAVWWDIARENAGRVAVQMPAHSGRYVLSVLDISDDGSVSAGSSTVVVR
jgi:hypothetical protein